MIKSQAKSRGPEAQWRIPQKQLRVGNGPKELRDGGGTLEPITSF